MHYKKVFKKIHEIEKEYKVLKRDLDKQPLLKSKKNNYLKIDKDEFIVLWKRYIKYFEKLKKLLRASAYRKFIFWINYNNLVLNKYLVHFYYKVIADLIDAFGKHEEFMRVFLDENFRRDYGVYAKYIYRPKYINVYNTPLIFIEPFEKYIDKEIYNLFRKIDDVEGIRRVGADYSNLFYWIKYRLDKIIFTIIKYVGNFMSNTKISPRKKSLIKEKNIKKYFKIACPGDILLTRSNRYLSNISIPGFWKHMSMYLGTGKYIKQHFKGDYLDNLKDNKHYIIEVNGKGVEILDIYDFITHHDYLCVIRTNFSKEKVKGSIKKALSNVGKGYDFIFNYYSDKKLVCSALVLKSYAKENDKDEGIEVELENISIGLTYPPNNLIKKVIEEQEKKDPELEGIFFIDSIEKTGENFVSTIPELIESGKRSRFSMFLK